MTILELREKRAVEAIKGRDRLLGARQLAVEQITRIVTRQALPSIIRNFLELTWSDVLVFVLLRHGQDSHTWQRSLEVAEQLAWSGTPLDSDGQQRLQKLRLALLEEQKSLPWQAVWEMYCQRHDTPAGSQWLDSVRTYEKEILSKRS